jgi:hypothetical protein
MNLKKKMHTLFRYRPNQTTKKEIDLRCGNSKTKKCIIFTKWIFWIVFRFSVLSHPGGRHRGGGQRQKPRKRHIKRIFGKAYRKVSHQNMTIPMFFRDGGSEEFLNENEQHL